MEEDWSTLSLRIGSTNGSTHIVQRSIKEISLAAAIDLDDIDILIEGSRSKDGLVSSELRKQIWPKLLFKEKNKSIDTDEWESLPKHKDELQIELDVNRSFVNYPIIITNEEKSQLKLKLQKILVRFFRTYPNLSYYQGLHDICSVFLLIFDEEFITFSFFQTFAINYLRDFMLPSIESSIQTLKIIPELLKEIDLNYFNKLILNLNDNPYFCISPIITLFAHDLKNLSSLCLIFDQILAYDSIEIIFLIYDILLVKRKDNILEKLEIIDEADDDFSKKDLIHNILSKFLNNIDLLDINQALEELPTYLKKYPIRNLKSFKNLNKYSVLKLKNSKKLSINELINLQIKESEKQNLIIKFHNINKLQVIKLSIMIGIIGIILNLLLQKRNSTIVTRYYLNLMILQPIKEYFNLF